MGQGHVKFQGPVHHRQKNTARSSIKVRLPDLTTTRDMAQETNKAKAPNTQQQPLYQKMLRSLLHPPSPTAAKPRTRLISGTKANLNSVRSQ
jgi:D-alanyl-D-alanine dipeptidase